VFLPAPTGVGGLAALGDRLANKNVASNVQEEAALGIATSSCSLPPGHGGWDLVPCA